MTPRYPFIPSDFECLIGLISGLSYGSIALLYGLGDAPKPQVVVAKIATTTEKQRQKGVNKMPRPPKKNQYKVKENRCVYVILNPYTKEFFVWYNLAGKENVRCAYKGHYTGRKYKTSEMICQMKARGLHPCYFQLDELYCTKVEAYRAVIGWSKVFVEQGYINVDKGEMKYYINDLFGETKEYYESKKHISIDQEFNCTNCIFPAYNRKKCETKARETYAERS